MLPVLTAAAGAAVECGQQPGLAPLAIRFIVNHATDTEGLI